MATRPAAKAPLRPPVLDPELAPRVLDALDEVDLERARLDAPALAGGRGARVRFDGVRVTGGTLGESKIEQLSWTDVACERCDLSLVDWPRAKLSRVELRDCRATGAKMPEAELDDVRFVGCHLAYAVFSEARLRRVSFERCLFEEADFTGADLAGASFVDCDMRAVDLRGAKLHGADVSASSLRDVNVRAADVRGLVVSREQAVVLARLFGLVVRDG